MPKYLTLALILLSLSTLKTYALPIAIGTPHDDSVKKIAIADARKFRLDKERLSIFRKSARQMIRDYYFPGGRPRPSLRPPTPPIDLATTQRDLRARRDGFQVYRRQRELASDFFKPIPSAVSDTSLLRDSVYVAAYREEAWKRTRRRRTFGHYAIIGGSVVGGATVIAGFVALMLALSRIKVG
ncbi:MAG: hypothetical protein JSU01_17670 [Bacteroidetes bacterium]|nr:hypothetical protein [Bacteroidota bacterium]